MCSDGVFDRWPREQILLAEHVDHTLGHDIAH